MMSYLHTKFHDFQRSCDDKLLGRTDRQTDGRSDPTPMPAFAFGDAGKNLINVDVNQSTTLSIDCTNKN